MVDTVISPWLTQLPKRKVRRLRKATSADIVIIGAGIAGISTAYFILSTSQRRVVVVDAFRMAHGATGRNAGQIVSYFERPFSELKTLYGAAASNAVREVHQAWSLLHKMSKYTVHKPVEFTGAAGCATLEQALAFAREIDALAKVGIKSEEILVLEEFFPHFSTFPFARSATVQELQSVLRTKDFFVAALRSRKGVMNSALFCFEMVAHLERVYKDRFSLYEQSPITKILCGKRIQLRGPAALTANQVVICTNGYKHIAIEGIMSVGDMLKGTVGHMVAFDIPKTTPSAITYFSKGQSMNDPYNYATFRDWGKQSLLCVGGPEKELSNVAEYHSKKIYLPSAERNLTAFAKKFNAGKKTHSWEGLMGYTPTGVRIVGPHPQDPRILYNLGCNGVGILPSIAGAKRIGNILLGRKVKRSMFDPCIQR